MVRPNRLRRSELSSPGSSPKMIAKAASSDADLAFLDLEDAVAPSEKNAARAHIVHGLTALDWRPPTRAYRINGVETPWCHDDLIEVVTGAGRYIDVIIVPKIKSPRDVWFVDDLLTQLELKLGLTVGRIGLEVLIEETEALACVEQIAAASPRLEALILGLGDLSASQGMRAASIGGSDSGGLYPYPGDVWHYARSRMIVAARANRLDAIDGPFGDFANSDGYRRDATWVSSLGAVGKWCIHPSQIDIANEVFRPTAAEVDQAHRMVDAMQKAEAEGLGAASVDGVLIDAATVRIYEAVLQRAQLCDRGGAAADSSPR